MFSRTLAKKENGTQQEERHRIFPVGKAGIDDNRVGKGEKNRRKKSLAGLKPFVNDKYEQQQGHGTEKQRDQFVGGVTHSEELVDKIVQVVHDRGEGIWLPTGKSPLVEKGFAPGAVGVLSRVGNYPTAERNIRRRVRGQKDAPQEKTGSDGQKHQHAQKGVSTNFVLEYSHNRIIP